ncbi:class 10 plant pathogenesis-related protein 2A-like [Prosopis cineraria]|uniref:class 10 plant pathogenesis-related protein 2A-like n=1 Tax=Prosopis cineraria TaxID=364024 RepID=UPI00240F9AF9|nr:class 10 plant pathogenesis-related protein 2A-like [Prosopis cineraria]
MGVFTYEHEHTSTLPPAKLYKAFTKDSDELIPKAVEPVQSIENVEGTGGPGTVKKLTIVEGGKTHHVLHKVEEVDEASYVYNYSIVEAGDLPETVEKISVNTKLVEGPNGGTVVKICVKYITKGDAAPSDEELKTGKGKGDALFKAIEAYLLAHPEYN